MSLNVIKVRSVITFGPGWCNKFRDWNTEWSDAITSVSQAIHFRYLLFQKLKRKVLGIITFHMNWQCLDFLGHYGQKGKDVSRESQIQCISGSFTLFYLSFETPLNSNFGADPSMKIFWIFVTVFLSDTLLMFSTIPFFTAPSTTGITTVFIWHIFCISSSRSLYLLFFSISSSAMFLSDGTVIWISLQVEFTESFVIIIIIIIIIVIIIIIIIIIIIVMSSVLVSEKFDQYHPDHLWFCCLLLFV